MKDRTFSNCRRVSLLLVSFSFFSCSMAYNISLKETKNWQASNLEISPNSALAQEKIVRTLSVAGQGTVKIPTTLADVVLGVEIRGKSATEVQQEVAKRTSAVVDLLKSRKVEQLQTASISLQADYDYSDNKRALIGYLGTNTVSFRLPTEQIGNLLDEVIKIGATRIDGISFTATEEAISAAQKEALQKAAGDALQQADATLSFLKLTRKDIINIQLNEASTPIPKMLNADRGAVAAAEATTPVIGGEQVIRASVTLQISY